MPSEGVPSEPVRAEPTVDLVLRPAWPEDLPAVAETYLRSRDAAYPAIPRGAHPPEEVRSWVGAWDLADRPTWLALAEGRVVGFASLHGDWLEALYVVPEASRRGVGSALLEVVKSLRPDGFGLWVFEANAPAREFYARHGLVEVERTDGSGNEEGEPDVWAVWPGRDPVGYLRRLIDDVDRDLAALLSRRAGLTAAVQRAKGPGARESRDPHREQEIVAAMAARAPALGADRLRRIVDVIVAESLDAARPG